MEKTIEVIKLCFEESDFTVVQDIIKHLHPEESVVVTKSLMSQEEYDNLPEWTG